MWAAPPSKSPNKKKSEENVDLFASWLLYLVGEFISLAATDAPPHCVADVKTQLFGASNVG